jgi:hypothetical protein
MGLRGYTYGCVSSDPLKLETCTVLVGMCTVPTSWGSSFITLTLQIDTLETGLDEGIFHPVVYVHAKLCK